MSELASLLVRIGADTSGLVSGLDRVDGRLDQTATRAEKFGEFAKVAFASAAAGAAAFAVDATRTFMQFESAMHNTQAVTGQSAAMIDSLGESVLRMGRVSRAGPVAVAESFYDVSSAIQDVDARLPTLQASINLAEAGNAQLSVTTDGLTSSLNAYGTEVLSATHASDVYARTVALGKGSMNEFVSAMSPILGLMSAAKVSFEEVGAAEAFMTSKGTPATMAATQLKAAVQSLFKPTVDLQRVYRELGIESGEAALEQYGLVGVLNMVSDAVGGSSSEMAALLGSTEALQAAVVLTDEGYAQFAQTFNTGLDGSTLSAQAAQMNTLAGQVDLIKSKWEAMKISAADSQSGLLMNAALGANAVMDIVDFVINPPDTSVLPTTEEIMAAIPDAYKTLTASVPASLEFTVPPGGTLWAISQDTGIPVDTLLAATGASSAEETKPGTYTVSYDALGNIEVNVESSYITNVTDAVVGQTLALDGSVASWRAYEEASRLAGESAAASGKKLTSMEAGALVASKALEQIGVSVSPKDTETVFDVINTGLKMTLDPLGTVKSLAGGIGDSIGTAEDKFSQFVTTATGSPFDLSYITDQFGGVTNAIEGAISSVTDFLGLTGGEQESGSGFVGSLGANVIGQRNLAAAGSFLDQFGGTTAALSSQQMGFGGMTTEQALALTTTPSPDEIGEDITAAVETPREFEVGTVPTWQAIGELIDAEVGRLRETTVIMRILKVDAGAALPAGASGPQLPGHASGADFIVGGGVGGADTVPVAFRATPGERVTVTPVGGQRGGSGGSTLNIHLHGDVYGIDGLIDKLRAGMKYRYGSDAI